MAIPHGHAVGQVAALACERRHGDEEKKINSSAPPPSDYKSCSLIRANFNNHISNYRNPAREFVRERYIYMPGLLGRELSFAD